MDTLQFRLGQGVFVALALGGVALACGTGGSKPGPAGPVASASASTSSAADAGPPAKAEKPFAGSTVEATQLVSAAVDKNREGVYACVTAYRKRKNLAHARVEVQVGIDQEGNLLGATVARGKPDEELTTCVQKALANAPFPRSHSGVISITKVYEEILQ